MSQRSCGKIIRGQFRLNVRVYAHPKVVIEVSKKGDSRLRELALTTEETSEIIGKSGILIGDLNTHQGKRKVCNLASQAIWSETRVIGGELDILNYRVYWGSDIQIKRI